MATLFLVVRDGDDNDTARGVLVIGGPGVLQDLTRSLARRLGMSPAQVRALRAVPVPGVREEGER
jgi:hypothetical protein